MRIAHFLALGFALTIVLLQSHVLAQSDVALDRFEPAPPDSRGLSIADSEVWGHWLPHFGLAMVYAREPLVAREVGEAASESHDVVGHQLTLHLLASVSLVDRFAFDVDFPATLTQDGASPHIAGAQLDSPSGAELNDVRIAARAAMVRPRGALPGAGARFVVWLPSGSEGSYTSTGEVRFGPELLLGGSYEMLSWNTRLGRRLQSDNASLDVAGSDWTFGAELGVQLGGLRVGPELFGSTVAGGGVDAFSEQSTSLEALLAARYEAGPVVFRLGGGPGLTRGQGTPRYRLIGGITFAPSPARERGSGPQLDDGLTFQHSVPGSSVEAAGRSVAVRVPPTSTADKDGDGILDRDDACASTVGVAHRDARRHGCPADRDDDGIFDVDDACPAEPGPPNDDPARYGCPADRDGDGILDRDDACPEGKGVQSDDPKLHGCKPSVSVEGEQLVLLQKINFATGSDQILEESDQVLEELAQVLKEHPEIARVAVDGHTDDVGLEASNLTLSRQRALAVVRWLVGHGVDERRLEARGYGPRRPIVPNEDDESRAKNRRVEFHILKRSPLRERGWKDGPIGESR